MRGKIFGVVVLILILIVPFVNVHAGLQDGLVAYYPFNGNANDESGNGNHGLVHGPILNIDRFGTAGNAYDFDGLDDYIEIPDSDSMHFGNGDFSFSIWLKYSSQQGGNYDYAAVFIKAKMNRPWVGPTLFVDWPSYGKATFRVDYDHELRSNLSNYGGNSWAHIVCIRCNNILYLYRNAVLDSTLVVPQIDVDNEYSLFIGANHVNQKIQNYYGVMDDLRIYNRAITQSEIQQLYLEGTNKPPVITSFTANPTTGASPLIVAFQCSAKDPDGSLAEYNWDLGNGSTLSTTTGKATYTYTEPGAYKAKVTVVDNNEATTVSDPVTINVSSTYSISGKVKTGTAAPISDVTMSLSGAASRTVGTDNAGKYTLSELQNGVYTITPSKDQYTFSPANRSVNINGADVSSQDFTGTLLGITVISPNGGESWPIGSSHTIKWAYSGDVGSNVRIDLLKGDLLAGTIIPSTPVGASGRGSYTWSIPSTVPSGADYRIGITSTGNGSYKDTGDSWFSIVAAAPTAGFSAAPRAGDAPLTVQFTDQSTGEITSRTWDFGDWTTSTDQHPTHTYSNPGSYDVRLSVTGPGGSDSEIKSNFINVSQPTTKYTLTVTKKGTGAGKVTSSPRGIDCGADCSEKYRLNTSVILTAVPGTSSVFSGWSGGGCSGAGECTVSMTENCNVTAKFDPRSSNKPDLVMTLFSAPVTAVAGETIQIPNTVKNQGKVSAGPFTIGIYLSKDKVLNPANDILLDSRDRMGLGAGQSSTAATSVNIPENISIGTYYIGAVADTKNVVDESNEANNTRITPKMIEIVSPLPDLIVTEVSGPVTAKMGEAVEVFDGVKNTGRSDARDEFSINIYLSKDAKINIVDDIYLGSHGLAGLSAGQTVRRKIEVTIPSGIEPGAYYLGAWVDSEDTILELDENNNIKSSISTIQVKK